MKLTYFKSLSAFALFLLFVPLNLQAQVTIRGEVLDETNGEPLIGANIILKDDPSKGTITDWDGSFEIKIPNIGTVLNFSYIGYTEKDITVESEEKLVVNLGEDAVTIDIGIEVTGQRVSDKQKAAPLTVESMDLLAIKETASENFYDGLGAMKGVDLTAASLGFKVINTRGFNSTSPVRSLQIIDGVDNQSPGLNFSLGNFLGSSDLDVLKVDLVQGASSAFYGPNAFNGVISMETKNPFYQKGLAAKIKIGERNLVSGAFRFADVLKNKNGDDFFGYKINFFFMQADDWEADNYDPVYDTNTDRTNPGGYDAVNIYGDEARGIFDQSSSTAFGDFAGLGQYHRRGYSEIDLVDYDSKNIKTNLALHFRTNPSKKDDSPELIFSSSYSNGTTVYQGDNRFSLKNIQFFQNRLEFRKKGEFFVRAYATSDDAGDSYDPFFTALRLQNDAKTDIDWNKDYVNNWRLDFRKRMDALEYPQLTIEVDSNGMVQTFFDNDAAMAWMDTYRDSLTHWHALNQIVANGASTGNTGVPFYEPGSPEFNEKFNQITTTLNNEFGGTKFHSRSDLYHLHGEYTLRPGFVDEWVIGANGRLYTPESRGTIFFDTAGIKITNLEVGAYTGLSKKFANDKLNTSVTLRVDKNENFNLVASPAASIVYKPKPGNYVRASFSSAVRNPTLSDQYLYLNVGPAILAGNLDGVDSLITVESFVDYLNVLDFNELKYFSIDPIQPERVKTFELGYRSTFLNSFYVDAGYYFSLYDDFIGYNIGIDAEFGGITNLPTYIQPFRYASNSSEQVTTQGFSIGLNYYFGDYFQLNGNYSWNTLVSNVEDPIIPAFNTPEHKYNLGFSGRSIPMRKGMFGFNINYKWVEGFLFEGSPQFTGLIPSYDLVDVQVNYFVKKWHTTFKLGASNILDNKQFQAYGGPRIGRLAYLSATYDFKKK